MRKIIQFLLRVTLSFFLSLRYKIEIKGIEHIEGNGLLLLPNHVSILDATIFQVFTWNRFHARPFATSRFTSISFLKPVFSLIGAISVPDCTVGKNSIKLLELEHAFQELLNGVEKGDNILFYPAGHLKISGVEKLGGASGLHSILSKNPDLKLVLVRTTGLWGSRFSPAPHGRTPDLKHEVLNALKELLRNFFMISKRKVTIELKPFTAPSPLPSRLVLNRELEDWYNAPFGEEGEEVFPPFEPKPFFPPIEEGEMTPLEKEIGGLVAKIAGYPEAEVKRDTHLSYDLGLDSLETTELFHVLEGKYHLTHLYSQEMITPYHIALQIEGRWRSERFFHKLDKEKKKLGSLQAQTPALKAPGAFSLEDILSSLKKSTLDFVAFDEILGLVTPKTLLKRIHQGLNNIISDERREIPLLFPPSLERSLATLAVYLAGKKPIHLLPKEASLLKGKIYSSHPIIQEWNGLELGKASELVVDFFDGQGKGGGSFGKLQFSGGKVNTSFAILKEPTEETLFEAIVRGVPFLSGSSHWVERLLSP